MERASLTSFDIIRLLLVWQIAKSNADLRKQIDSFRKMMREAGVDVAAAKSREEQIRLDGLLKKGPVGGGAGGRSSKITKSKKSNCANGGSASEGEEEASDSEPSLPGPGASESEDEPDEDLEVEIKAMVWTSIKMKDAFFIGRYLSQDENVKDRFDIKPTLIDWPETALKFVYMQYGHDRSTVEYIERQCKGMFEFPNSKKKGKVLPGFTTLQEYARLHNWELMEDKWKKRFTSKGTPILQRLNLPNVDENKPEGKKGVKGKPKKVVASKNENRVNRVSNSKEVPVQESVMQEREIRSVAVENVVVDPVEDPVLQTCIVSEMTTPSNQESLGLDATNFGVDTPVVEEESGLPIGVDNEVVQDANVAEQQLTPTKGKKRQFYDLKDDNAVCEACKPGVNHQWHEFTTGSYVTTGFLSGGKRCIGERDGKER